MTGKDIMDGRDKTYNAQMHRFALVTRMYDQWEAFRVKQGELPPQKEQALRHGIRLLIDEITKLAVTPCNHPTTTNIAGYAACIRNIVDLTDQEHGT